MSISTVLILQALSSAFMAGVIWTMQLVHYPLFARVGRPGFCEYQRNHMRRITWIVAPTMGIELITAMWLFAAPPIGIPQDATTVGAALVVVIWLSTALFQGPAHAQLLRMGFEPARLRFLLATNWIRTAAWSVRAPLSLMMLIWAGRVTVEGNL